MKEGIDYKRLCHKIIALWRDNKVPLNDGATEQELSEFEIQLGLALPADFRYFYSQVNGMPDLESDARLFSLWSISRMIQETDGITFDRNESPLVPFPRCLRLIRPCQSSFAVLAPFFCTGDDSTIEVSVEPYTLNLPMIFSKCETDEAATLKTKESLPLT
jgi:SMI1 / KNR4 family (SUKH-1)